MTPFPLVQWKLVAKKVIQSNSFIRPHGPPHLLPLRIRNWTWATRFHTCSIYCRLCNRIFAGVSTIQFEVDVQRSVEPYIRHCEVRRLLSTSLLYPMQWYIFWECYLFSVLIFLIWKRTDWRSTTPSAPRGFHEDEKRCGTKSEYALQKCWGYWYDPRAMPLIGSIKAELQVPQSQCE